MFGGRDFWDRDYVFEGLDRIAKEFPIGFVMTGGQVGTDTWGLAWAKARGIPRKSFVVDTKIDGPWPRAGNRRNWRMFFEGAPTLGACTVGGPGTQHMRGVLTGSKIRVLDI